MSAPSPEGQAPAAKRQRVAVAAADAAGDAPASRRDAAARASAPASPASPAPPAVAAPPAAPRVLIWDLDETLIIFNSLLDRSFVPVDCAATSRRALAGVLPPVLELRELAAERERLANAWSTLVLSVCDENFFFRCLEDCESTMLTDHEGDDDGAPLSDYDFDEDALGRLARHRFTRLEAAEGRVRAGEPAAGSPAALAPPPALSEAQRRRLTAYRLRVAGQRYAAGVPLRGAEAEAWHRLYAETDAFSQRWLSAGRTAVEEAAAAGFTNVLVTAGCLLPTLAKLQLFKLDGLFEAPHAVMSARGEGKAACFAKIAARYGPDARFCVIGDGCEEAEAARALNWPLLAISPVVVDGGMPPHSITVDVLRRRIGEE